MTILSLGNAILLKGVWARTMVDNTLTCKIIPKNELKLFTAISSVEDLNGGFELCFDHRVEFLEN